MNDHVIECPCYHICAGLGLEMSPWCRYHESDVPPPGMHRFNPKEEWCPSGVQANVLMLAHMLGGEKGEPEQLAAALEQVRLWAQEVRRQRAAYDPLKSKNT